MGLVALAIALTACPSEGGNKPAETTDVSEHIHTDRISLRYDRHLYLDVMVHDTVPASMIFDTGATGLYVDSLWLVESGIEPAYRQAAMIGGAGGGYDRTELFRDTLDFSLDSVRWSSQMTVILQLKEILGRQADGIIGQAYLSNYCVEFNLRDGYMRRVSPDTLARAGFVRHDVDKRGDKIYVRAGLELDAQHEAEGMFLLDTGAPHSMSLSPFATSQVGFDSYSGSKIAFGTKWGGIGGKTEGFYCKADAVIFGGHRFVDVPVDVSATQSAYTANNDVMGVVGNELFERFDMVIDFANPALWLRPAEGIDEPFSFVSPGFSVVDRTDICDGWLVSRLLEPPYAPAGLKQGDVVVTLDGVPVKELDNSSTLSTPGLHRIEVLRGGVRTEYEFETKEIL
jgi:hypothetical protein